METALIVFLEFKVKLSSWHPSPYLGEWWTFHILVVGARPFGTVVFLQSGTSCIGPGRIGRVYYDLASNL